MNEPAAAVPLPDVSSGLQDHPRQGMLKLAVGAVGIVFGDIGTSPIYACRETFAGHHPIAVDPLHIHGVLSLIFWSMMIVVTVKYVGVIMRADNKGEGGVLALATLATRGLNGKARKVRQAIVVLAVIGLALFYGDAIITPAVSVMGAVEGLSAITPAFTCPRDKIPVTAGCPMARAAHWRFCTSTSRAASSPIRPFLPARATIRSCTACCAPLDFRWRRRRLR